MSRQLGYIVVEWNQASHRPGLNYADLHDDRADAERDAEHQRAQTAEVGRRERYAVAEVLLDDEEEPR